MRVLLDRLDPLLAEALAALLTHEGHEVVAAVGAEGSVGLTVRAEPAGAEAVPRGAVLALRPAEGRPASDDPVRALRRALEEGGEVVWRPPLEPARLLEVLAAHRGRPGGPARPLAGGAAFAAAPDAWFVLDVVSGALEPLGAAAGACQASAAGGALGGPVGPPPALLEAVRACEHGRRLVGEVAGREALAVWWTPEPQRRLLGWIPWARLERVEDLATLHALAELGRISSTFAHEVRNPLASFASALDLLRRPMTDAERLDVLTLAQGRVAHLRTLLDDTLRLVRSFRGPPQPVDLGEVVASALGIARGDPAFRGLAIEVVAPDALPAPLSWAEPLRQALTNLLLNAAQAQGARGRLRICVEPRGSRVVLAVEDEGPGIPADQRAKVFDPFWTTKLQGTGLGLAFVKRLADASGGSARVADVPPPGARVEIELPRAV